MVLHRQLPLCHAERNGQYTFTANNAYVKVDMLAAAIRRLADSPWRPSFYTTYTQQVASMWGIRHDH